VTWILVAGVAIYWGTIGGVMPGWVGYTLLSGVVVGYALLEIRSTARRQPNRWLVNPVVMCTIFMFVLGGYGLSNVIFVFPESSPDARRFFPRLGYEYLVPAVLLSLIALVGMWAGYHSSIGKWIVTRLRGWSLPDRLIRSHLRVRWGVLVLLAVVSVGAAILNLQLGISGYISTEATRSQYTAASQYIFILRDMGSLILAIACLDYFSGSRKASWKVVFIVLFLIIQVLLGFLSGYKSQPVFPFVVLGVCYYLVRGHIPWSAVVGTVVAVLLAYAIVEPFRSYYNQYLQGRSDVGIVQTGRVLTGIATGRIGGAKSEGEGGLQRTWKSLLERRGLTRFTALSMKYEEETGLENVERDFLLDIFLSPAYAVIPRVIWPSKPRGNLGGWYYQEVVKGKARNNATGIGPISYLWFSGGFLAVFMGFWVVGILQKVSYEYLLLLGGGYLLVFIVLIPSLVKIPKGFYVLSIDIIRNTILAVFAQKIILKKEDEN
jgi:hypothetical protein